MLVCYEYYNISQFGEFPTVKTLIAGIFVSVRESIGLYMDVDSTSSRNQYTLCYLSLNIDILKLCEY